MKTPKIYTYSPKNATTAFELYALSKGLNSGKPLELPAQIASLFPAVIRKN